MAGHNKWSKIKRKKGVADAKRSKIFSRLIKEITVAVKEGGSAEPEFNPRLRLAIQNAKGVNMPKENVERAVKKANDTDSAKYTELNYEGYAPGGIALFVECLSDNQNRTVSNVRSYFNKLGGSLATSGSVDFLFDRKGVFVFSQGEFNEDDLTLELIDAGADDLEFYEGEVTVFTELGDYGNMQKKLEELNIETNSVDLQRIPKTTNKVDVETARKVLKLVETLEDDDDVQAVFHNMEMTEEIISALEADA
ncbi:MAG: YebC/PmpR family DNA-binding transcriptional regulator [Chitinophagaceae bacterium]|nr:MAG: YebC/PmpR family DNA-binding transcriptional regulator [Chitinophagaceae bacterium]